MANRSLSSSHQRQPRWIAARVIPSVTLAALALLIALSLSSLALTRGQAAAEEICTVPNPERQVAGSVIALLVDQGDRVLFDSIAVTGDIDLSGVDTAEEALILTNSVVEGQLLAPFTVFNKTVSFANTCFLGGRHPELFPEHSPNAFNPLPVSRNDANGAGRAIDGVVSDLAIDMRGAIFEADARFTEVRSSYKLGGKVDFSGARFKSIGDFRHLIAIGDAAFADATFEGRALFQLSEFEREATFDGASFAQDLNFLRGKFQGRLGMEGVTVAGDANFSGVQLPTENAVLQRMNVNGRLDLRDAEFRGTTVLDELSAGELDLRDGVFTEAAELRVAGLRAAKLRMGLDAVDAVASSDELALVRSERQIAVLRMVEDTARNEGDAEIANDAAYKRRVEETGQKGRLKRWTRVLIGQYAFGYIVRPTHPIIAMAALASLGLVVRLAYRLFRRPKADKDSRWLLTKWTFFFVTDLGQAIGVALYPKPSISLNDSEQDSSKQNNSRQPSGWELIRTSFRWMEFMLQKSLNGVAIIALGNASPEFRDFISSVLNV